MRPAVVLILIFIALRAATPAPRALQLDASGAPVSLDSAADDADGWLATAWSIDPREESARGPREPSEEWHRLAVPGYSSAVPALAEAHQRQSLPEFWMRRDIQLPAGTLPPLSVHLHRINDRDRVYWNGELIGATGKWDAATPGAYDIARTYPIPERLLRPAENNVLLVHVQGYAADYVGFDQEGMEIGATAQVLAGQQRRDLAALVFLIAYAVVGAYFLFLFVRRRQERENLIFAVFCLVLVTYQFLKEQFKYQTGFSFLALKRVEFVCLYALFPIFYLFLRYYFHLPGSRLARAFDAVAALTALILSGFIVQTLVVDNPDTWWRAQILPVERFSWPLLIIAMLGRIILAIRARDPDALLVLIGFLLQPVSMVVDQLSSHGVIALRPIGGFLFSAFVFMIAVILSNRFLRLHRQVEDLNQNLEKKVEERTQQLQESLAEVNALKVQQDGDYFLTSLLLQPLGENLSRNDRVHVEFLVHQKKRFRFRKWEAEIGGDLCAAHDIKLQGASYTAVMNADAMGKSIQGAGGALVLGTAFKSLITRTEHSADYQKKSPERWLMDCFLELQDVFVSFDGRMLVSAVLGLVDESSGAFYYLNSDHPKPVLLRRGEASFVGDDGAILRKLGVEHQDIAPSVAVLQLERDDILVLGSDGRDDLHIGVDAKGNRIINEDYELFRRFVAESGGDLRRIFELLSKQGILTDDLTLLRIGYMEDWPLAADAPPAPAALDVARSLVAERRFEDALQALETALASVDGGGARAEHLDLLAECALRSRRGDAALQYSLDYFNKAPADSDGLFRASQAARLASRFDLAVELGERVRLRRPLDGAALAALADSWRRQGQIERARLLLLRAVELAPNHPAVQRIAAAMAD